VLILSVPAGVAAALFLAAPGVLWSWLCWPTASRVERLAVGLALSFAFQMHVAALLAVGPGITTVSVLLATLAGLLLAALLAWRMRLPRSPESGEDRRGTLALVAALAVITAFQMAPLVVHQIPQGWDPSFHSLLASTTVDTGRLPTWAPYEPIPSNYPYGPHVIIAEVSLLSGLAPDQAFAVLLNAVLPAITGLALYAFARRALPTQGASLAAVAAYGLLGNWGSLDNPRWGGLPNALGFFMLLAFLTVLFGVGFERVRVIVGGLLLGAIPLSHHHVMLTTVLLLGAYGAYLIARALRAREPEARREHLRMLRRLLLMGAVALVTVAYFVVPFALRARELQDSSVLRYFDHDPGVIFIDNGWLIWALALAGAGMLLVSRAWRNSGALRNPALGFAAVASVALFAAFFCGYYVYRAYSLRVYHQPFTAFTPTRFLTDLTYFMAPFAGLALDALWRRTARLPERFKRVAGFGAVSGAVARCGIALALVVTAGVTMLAQFQPGEGTLLPGEAEAFAWVRAHTPQNTLVINLDQNARWAPYFTRREVAYTPVPVSEFTGGYVAEKQFLVNRALNIHEGGVAPRVVAAANAGSAMPALEGRPVAVIADQTDLAPLGSPAFTAGTERVYLISDFFAPLRPSNAASVRWWSGSGAPPAGWQMPDAQQSGWVAPPPRAGMAYLRLALPAVPRGAVVACRAEGAVTLYVDGRLVPGGCQGGGSVPLPQLEGPGAHVLAARARLGQNLGPWFDLFVLASGARG
jgi:hypothetical protein